VAQKQLLPNVLPNLTSVLTQITDLVLTRPELLSLHHGCSLQILYHRYDL